MKAVFLKAWKDPVWSKVIATAITGITGVGGLVIYDELSKNNLLLIINTYIFLLLTFQINIPVWIIFLSLLLVVGFSFLFLAGRRSLPSYRTLSVKKNIKKAYSKSIISNILNEGFIPNNIKLEILGYQQNDPS